MDNHKQRARRFLLMAVFFLGCADVTDKPLDTPAGSQSLAMLNGTCESAHTPRLVTDREDYTSGLLVHLTGKDLNCGEGYLLVIERPDGTSTSQQLTADESGTVEGTYPFGAQGGDYHARLYDSMSILVAHTHFHGSHFRYGHLTWRPTGSRTAEFTLINAFRRGYIGSGPDGLVVTGDYFVENIGGTRLCFGDGACTSSLIYEVISYDVAQGWVIGRAVPNAGQLQTMPGTGVTVQESEPNDDLTTANIMNLGDDYQSTIASPGNSDFVRFTLAQRMTVSIRTVLQTMRDSMLYLYDSNGQLLEVDDDDGGGFASLISITLAPGTYFIRAAGFSSSTGQMTVELRQTTITPPGSITHTYPGDGPFTASISSCCRIDNLRNSNSDYLVQTPVRFNLPNSAPVSGLPPIVNVPVNTPDFTFQIPAIDAEGDELTFRLAAPAESGIYNPIPGLTVSSTGLVSWSTLGTAVGQLWTTQVVIEERRNGQLIGSSAVDFLLRIVTAIGSPPVCILPAQTSYTVFPGQPLEFSISTADADVGDVLTLNTGGLPPGASLQPPLPLQGPAGIGTTFHWTPSSAAAGSAFVVSFTVTDSNGQADQCAVTINTLSQQPSHPPQALCKDVTIVAQDTCAMEMDINDGSLDVDGDLVGCTQDPPGPYLVGTTAVTLRCTDAGGRVDTCTATVTVMDQEAPTIALNGPASASLECGSPYTDPGATASDLCFGDLTGSITTSGSVNPGMPGSYTLTYGVTDPSGNSSALVSRTVTVTDTLPPAITCPAPIITSCTGNAQGPATPGVATATDACMLAQVTGPTATSYPLGTTPVTYTAVDGSGNQSSCVSTITVVDHVPPVVTVAGPNNLWPPHHKYRTLSLADCGIAVQDSCSGAIDLTSAQASITCVSSDEPLDGTGDGNTESDILLVDAQTVMLRSERLGPGDGRVYKIYFTVQDPSGNTTQGVCVAAVPHDDHGSPAVDSGEAYRVCNHSSLAGH